MTNDSFTFFLVTAARLMRAKYEAALGEANLGVTPAEARALMAAQRHQPVRQTDLAVVLGIEPMTLVNHLDRLEAQDLIRREPSPKDRRSKEVVVTDNAKPTLRSIRRVLNNTVDQALSSFTESEQSQLTDLLERLCYELNPSMIPDSSTKN